MAKWYAVQENRTDAWDNGSYDFGTAAEMLRAQGHGLIAAINEDTGLCDEELEYDTLFGEYEEPDEQAIEEARAAAEAQALAAAAVEAARAGGKTGIYEFYYTGAGYPTKEQIDAQAKALGFEYSYWAGEYGYNAMYNGDTVVVYNSPDDLPPLMRKDALKHGKPVA